MTILKTLLLSSLILIRIKNDQKGGEIEGYYMDESTKRKQTDDMDYYKLVRKLSVY